jgi:acyl-[acyl-carrier-protein]-phospholipid O-acyltransferase/long-chain-fatty-acid--[acyl-carrier-protein] ligase
MPNVKQPQARTEVPDAQSTPSNPSSAEDGRGAVFSLGYLALVATQFFVSLNDNMFRWLVAPVGKELFRRNWHDMPAVIQRWMNPDGLALSLGLASFTLPFLLLAAPAGYLADRFSKRNVMVAFKAIEIAVICLGIAAILWGNVPMMFVMVFILGGQATMFVTSKLGAIPELVRSDKISAANGLINMVSMSAMIFGGVAGNWLYAQTTPAGQQGWWKYAVALLGVAVCGLVASLFIGRRPAANPRRSIPWNPAAQTLRDLGTLRRERPLFLAALGSAFFWTLGALSNLNIDQFATIHLGLGQEYVGPLLAVLTLGIGIGALLAGMVSHGKIELGLVPLGAAGMALTSILIVFVPGSPAGQHSAVSYWISAALLAVMGITAGLYDIPLQAFLQDRSRPEARGSIMAAYNFLAFAGILVASAIYWLLTGPFGLSSRVVFLLGGIVTIPVTFAMVRLLPYQTTRMVARLVVRCLYRLRVEGQENVPPSGGVLLAANHVSWADAILIGLACPRHPRMIAYAKYFENPWLGWFGRMCRIIPIGTTRKSMAESIRAARAALEEGDLVCIFPEGGITRTGKIEEFRPGFLSILKDTDVPVVPVCLKGLWGSIFSFEGGRFFWKWPRRWPYPVSVRFGRPIHRPESAQQVQQAVAELQRGLEVRS